MTFAKCGANWSKIVKMNIRYLMIFIYWRTVFYYIIIIFIIRISIYCFRYAFQLKIL